MLTMTKRFSILLTLCLCSQVLLTAAEGKTVSKIMSINTNLPIKELGKEVLRLTHERKNLIDSLIRQLRREKNLKKKIRICFLLGQYRASEATSDLLNIITLKNKDVPEEDTRFPLWGRYPAFEALGKIGMPSARLILAKLETESNTEAMRFEVILIRELYGKEIARIVLEKAIAKQKNKRKAENIAKAISLFRWSKRK
ncbi:MAG: HEAT repeat domain-containing protein [Victivallaceae bacterium]|nr:HEAT repeat domain-containing protein [Victivallaceae bacterium]